MWASCGGGHTQGGGGHYQGQKHAGPQDTQRRPSAGQGGQEPSCTLADSTGLIQLTQSIITAQSWFQTKVWRVFLLVIHSHLYSFALIFIFLQNHATSYSFCKEETRRTWKKPYPPSLWLQEKSIQKPQVWKISRFRPRNLNEIVRTWIRLLYICFITTLLFHLLLSRVNTLREVWRGKVVEYRGQARTAEVKTVTVLWRGSPYRSRDSRALAAPFAR